MPDDSRCRALPGPPGSKCRHNSQACVHPAPAPAPGAPWLVVKECILGTCAEGCEGQSAQGRCRRRESNKWEDQRRELLNKRSHRDAVLVGQSYRDLLPAAQELPRLRSSLPAVSTAARRRQAATATGRGRTTRQGGSNERRETWQQKNVVATLFSLILKELPFRSRDSEGRERKAPSYGTPVQFLSETNKPVPNQPLDSDS